MISVIVPVYNVELYLQECIDSILTQSYTDIELLLIDDGSKDSSYDICKKYESKDERIKVYKKANGGVSSARNLGIEKAQGEWITFIDSDDYLLNNNYLLDLAEATYKYNTDYIITTGCIKFGYEKKVFNDSAGKVEPQIILKNIIGLNNIYLSPWGRLYRTSIIKKYNIRFLKGLHYAEDCYFNIEYIRYISSASVVENKGYYYRENTTSITHNYRPYTHHIDFLEHLFNFYNEYKQKYDIKQIDDYFIGFHLIGNSLSIIQDLYHNQYGYQEKKYAIRRLKEIIRQTGGVYKKYLVNYKVYIKIIIIQLPFWISNSIYKIL